MGHIHTLVLTREWIAMLGRLVLLTVGTWGRWCIITGYKGLGASLIKGLVQGVSVIGIRFID